MYSPRIKPELIPQLYQIKTQTGTTMTKVVDSMIREGIRRWNQQKEGSKNHENYTVHGPASSEGGVGI